MLILPVTMKAFNLKDDKGVFQIEVSLSSVKDKEITDILRLKNAELSMALNNRLEKEKYRDELEQLNFMIKCPACSGYNCLIGKALAFCKDCKIEFAIDEEVKRYKPNKEQWDDLYRLAKEAGFERKTPQAELREILLQMSIALLNPECNRIAALTGDDFFKESNSFFNRLTLEDYEIVMTHLNSFITREALEKKEDPAEAPKEKKLNKKDPAHLLPPMQDKISYFAPTAWDWDLKDLTCPQCQHITRFYCNKNAPVNRCSKCGVLWDSERVGLTEEKKKKSRKKKSAEINEEEIPFSEAPEEVTGEIPLEEVFTETGELREEYIDKAPF